MSWIVKSQLFRAQDVHLEVSLQAGITELVASLGSADFKEGAAQFVEKRAPHFSGK